jgi:2,4-diaminopentanoate dehydrogenase
MEPKGIVLYGPGRIGQLVARLVVERRWRIAAAINRAGPKIGHDLGLLCGLGRPIGVTVQDESVFDLDSVHADIAVVTSTDRIAINFSTYKRFLEAGLNVLSVGCEASFPRVAAPELADKIDDLAKSKGVTFTGSGFQDVYRVSLAKTLIGACASLKGFHNESHVDIAPYGVESARLVHAGLGVEEFRERCSATEKRETSIYRVFFEQVARSTGIRVLSVKEWLEPVTAQNPLFCPALQRNIGPGMVTGTRFRTDIELEGGVYASAINELRLFEPGEQERLIWTIDGAPPARVVITGLDSYQGTVAPLVNRIPDVLAAPPGIVTIDQLGPPRFLGNP